jgi:hypothetical protein
VGGRWEEFGKVRCDNCGIDYGRYMMVMLDGMLSISEILMRRLSSRVRHTHLGLHCYCSLSLTDRTKGR